MDKQKAGWSDWWHFFQILVNSEWIVIMLSDYSTYLIMSHHLTLIHTLQQLMNSTKLFLQSFNFSFASPEQNRCAIYLRFQKKILSLTKIFQSYSSRLLVGIEGCSDSTRHFVFGPHCIPIANLMRADDGFMGIWSLE